MATTNPYKSPKSCVLPEQDSTERLRSRSYQTLLFALSLVFALIYGWSAYAGFSHAENIPSAPHPSFQASIRLAGAILCVGAAVLALANRAKMGWAVFSLATLINIAAPIFEIVVDQ